MGRVLDLSPRNPGRIVRSGASTLRSRLSDAALSGLPGTRRLHNFLVGFSTAYSLAMAELWDLVFTLPNLAVPIPTPYATGGYAICSATTRVWRTWPTLRKRNVPQDAGAIHNGARRSIQTGVFPDQVGYPNRRARWRNDPSVQKRLRALYDNRCIRRRPGFPTGSAMGDALERPFFVRLFCGGQERMGSDP